MSFDWHIRYEPQTHKALPWSVYKVFDDRRIFKQGFQSEDEARHWANNQQKAAQPEGENKVDESSMESFPASDPPSWIKITASVANVDSSSNSDDGTKNCSG